MKRALWILPLALLLACEEPGTPEPDDGYDRGPLLANVMDGILLPALDDFEVEAQGLAAAAATLEANPTDTAAREAAQAAWSRAALAWQRVEPLQIGPLGAAGVRTGGESLRDEIYSWPTRSPCAVDQQLVANAFGAADYTATHLVNTYGLDALEYLLFVDGDTNDCANAATLNQDGSWDALVTGGGLALRRAQMARALADALVVDAARVKAAMVDFAPTWKDAGSGAVFVNAQAAVDELFAALFYVELRVKDRKLAVPAGLHVDCATETCPDQVESVFAQRSREQILANLESARAVLTGGEGEGFDDMLVALNGEDLAGRMIADLDAAIAGFEAFAGTLQGALETDPASVVALHDLVKAFTDDLKAEFVTVLNLRVPQEGAGDND